jgi:hypothetical protein
LKELDRISADAILRAAVIKSYERGLHKFNEDEKAERQATDEIIFSKAREKRMRRIFLTERLKRAAYRARRIAYKTAVAASIAITALALASLTNGNVRAAVRGLVAEWYDAFTSFRSAGASDSVKKTAWVPVYVPDGFTETSSDFGAEYSKIWYENAGGAYIDFRAYASGSASVSVDNEHSEYGVLSENGIDYHVFRSVDDDSPSYVLWTAEGYDFVLSSGTDAETLLEIAFSVAPRGGT